MTDRTRLPEEYKMETNGKLFRLKCPNGLYYGGEDNTADYPGLFVRIAWDQVDAQNDTWIEVDA